MSETKLLTIVALLIAGPLGAWTMGACTRPQLRGMTGFDALDELAAALVGIEAASEWRVELTAVMADAYRGEGHDEVAASIEEDLRRLHPRSRWLSSISN